MPDHSFRLYDVINTDHKNLGTFPKTFPLFTITITLWSKCNQNR